MHFFAERVEFHDVTHRVFLIFERVIGIDFRQSIAQFDHLPLAIRDAQPHVRIELAVDFDRLNVLGFRQIDDRQRLVCFGDFVEERLHAVAVDDKHVGSFERFHVLGRELVIVQATGCRRSEIDDFDIFDAGREVERIDADRVERRDDAIFAVGTVSAAATEHQHRKKNQ